ncbi:TMV resistance protein N-like [Eucalyptus grandis]|uniref:TMV resistance protein N-like n=1 Tax=Eucalyptus grandis TaxID=71139 RepID=UPI00192F0F03|nr:TMV resistance protein N-like [Eucalyptus grandis]
MADLRNRLKTMQKEKGKEKTSPTGSSSIIIRDRPEQMMLSNPLESFLKDLSTQKPDSVIQQPDPLKKQTFLSIEQAPQDPQDTETESSVSSSSSSVDTFPIAPITSSIFMADSLDDDMESDYSDPEIGQTSKPTHQPHLCSLALPRLHTCRNVSRKVDHVSENPTRVDRVFDMIGHDMEARATWPCFIADTNISSWTHKQNIDFPAMALPIDTSTMKFEVFLSFRGSDTRDNFTSCLYHDMIEKGIRVFKDDEELPIGQKIEELLQALNDSQIYIPIFSEDFASSAWCLREIARMVDCTSKSNGKKEILPVFFNVEPDDVKLKTKRYTDALSKLQEKYPPDEVKHWGDALVEVPTRVGWKLKGHGYGELVKSIVREVQLKLTRKNRYLPDHLVETDDLEQIEELLDVDSDDHVHFIVIHGTGGIGKSTLASVIFNRFRSKFNCSSFLEDVQHHSLLDMQKKLLSETLGSTSTYGMYDTNDGIDHISKGLSNMKVLVVLDNVDDKMQLEKLAGSYNWFGSGSRIIVTVRDISTILHEKNQTRCNNYKDYPVKEMPLNPAIQLFSKHAFRSDTPPKDWYKLSKEVVLSIGRLPLTLEVVGSHFAGKIKSEWDKTLKSLKQAPHRDVRKALMISIEKLDSIEKAIFLDIACFCIGEDKMKACYMWDDCSAVDVLLLMSLIKIDKENKFWMHDELWDLGRYIVKKESFEDAGKRCWVGIDESNLDILRSNEEKRNVRALSLGISHDLKPKELAYFPKLKFLGGERMNFLGNFKNLLPDLKWLSWRHCLLNLRARNLHLVNLVVLDLSQSNINDDWGGWRQIKMAKKLKVLDLAHCRKLTKTPDFSEFGKLEKLILTWCVKLSTIDSSIGKLQLLNTLNIEGCISLQGLPEEIGLLKCLLEIIVPWTSKPFKLPETLSNLHSLMKFEIQGHSSIRQLPHSIGMLMDLTHLHLRKCQSLHKLPDSIGELQSLVELDLESSGVSILPDSIGNMKRLKVIRLAHTKIHTIPCALGQVETLEVLDASFCPHLMDEIPWRMWSLTRLRIFAFDGTPISTVPEKISNFSSLQTIIITSHRLCPLPELPSSLKCLVVEAAELPVLPNLSSLLHLNHLEVCRRHPIIAFWSANEVISPWKDAQSIHQLPHSLSTLKLGWIPQLPEFSNFKRLSILSISGCPMPHLPILKYLERLRELEISLCEFLESTPDLSCLKRLQKLQLSDLPKLAEIPGLGELESLKFLYITMCNVIRQLPYLSKLKNLQHLKLDGCEKIRAVEGLEELNFLKKVEIEHCMCLKRLPDVVATSSGRQHGRTYQPEAECIIPKALGLPIRAHHVGFKLVHAIDSNSVRPRHRLQLRSLAGDIVAHLAVDSDFVLPTVDDSTGSDRVEPISGSSPRSEPAALSVNLRTRALFSEQFAVDCASPAEIAAELRRGGSGRPLLFDLAASTSSRLNLRHRLIDWGPFDRVLRKFREEDYRAIVWVRAQFEDS